MAAWVCPFVNAGRMWSPRASRTRVVPGSVGGPDGSVEGSAGRLRPTPSADVMPWILPA
jgi:hypothetical protein